MQNNKRKTETGCLYVLTHPSDPNLYKVGKTIRSPEARLAEHNSRVHEYAGQIVKETGLKWELKTHISVPDTYWAEAVFWAATGLADIPFRGGIEVVRLDTVCLETGLAAVKKAGIRPPPPPMDEHIYAYRAWMNKRLRGRGINLLGHVRSKFGKANFRCDLGHEWRTVPAVVAEGEGCPQCGMGKATIEEIERGVKAGVLCLLVHPDKPGLIKIGITSQNLEQASNEALWGDWQVHRFRNVEEPELAETIIWGLLGCPRPKNGEPISLDLNVAEEAFRAVHYRLVSEIAFWERAKDAAGTMLAGSLHQ